jgi:predicted nicotinamide N-methyase
VPKPPVTLSPVPLVPEISLHLAGPVGLFDASGGEFRSEEPPPFWAFAWAGGQALARYVLDNPGLVAGRSVLDIATGSGLAAIAAAKAGAKEVRALDLDPAAAEAARRNAAANGVLINAESGDVEAAGGADVILAGDVFYSRSVADRMALYLRGAARSGALILVGDPGRGYFPDRLFSRVVEYNVPVPAALEETESLVTGVWQIRRGAGRG